MMQKVVIFNLLLLLESTASAQLLPKGVGAYQMGYRKFDPKAQYFDEHGHVHGAGDKFSTDFTAGGVSEGNSGSDFRRLYEEVKKFDSKGATQGVADDMNFGQVRGDIQTDIQAKYFGLAYGLNDRFTVFGAIPYVTARSDAQFHYGGVNNAAEIKSRLGNLVYKEIQDAFDQASRLSDETIRDNLQNVKGYKSLDHWNYSGLGDVPIGLKTELVRPNQGINRLKLGLSGQFDLATGYQDDPDILIDLPISRGYHAATIAADTNLTRNNLELGVLLSITLGLPRDVIKRVPDGFDPLPGSDRKTTVHLQPGQDLGSGIYGGIGNQMVKGLYTIGAKKHLRDKMTGSLEGDYDVLEASTETYKAYHRVSLTLSTVDAFARKKFAIPFIVALSANDTFAGVNTGRERYIELSLTSFFSTPAAVRQADGKPDRKPDRKIDKKSRRVATR